MISVDLHKSRHRCARCIPRCTTSQRDSACRKRANGCLRYVGDDDDLKTRADTTISHNDYVFPCFNIRIVTDKSPVSLASPRIIIIIIYIRDVRFAPSRFPGVSAFKAEKINRKRTNERTMRGDVVRKKGMGERDGERGRNKTRGIPPLRVEACAHGRVRVLMAGSCLFLSKCSDVSAMTTTTTMT